MTTGVLDPRTDMLIDMIQPVNLLHPLNRGLIAWYKALPGNMGARRFMDIANPGPNGFHGVLNMDPVTGWIGSDRLGGLGSLLFDGVSDHVETGEGTGSPLEMGFQDWTVTAWFKGTDGTLSGILTTWGGSGADGKYSLVIGESGGTPNKLDFGINRASTDAADRRIAESVTDVNDGEWHMGGGTRLGVDMAVFVDGEQEGTAVQAFLYNVLMQNLATFNIGRGFDEGWDFTGQIDDVRVSNRGLSPTEMRWLYNLSFQDYPGMLNRLPPISSGMIAAALPIPPIPPIPPVEGILPEYGQGRAAIGDPPVYGATIVKS